MKDETNVVHLSDFTHKNKELKILNESKILTKLSKPETHLVRRIFSFGIDLLTIMVLKSSIHVAYAVFINELMSPLSFQKKQALINGSMPLHLMTFMAIYFTYFFYTSFILNGKTLGKMAMNLTVISEHFIYNREETDYHLSLKECARRAFGYLFCFMSFGIFFIFNFSSEDKRGLADYISGSRTVSDDWLAKAIETKKYDHEHVYINIEELKESA